MKKIIGFGIFTAMFGVVLFSVCSGVQAQVVPAIEGLSVPTITSSSVTITWVTGIPSTSQVLYDTINQLYFGNAWRYQTTIDTSLTYNHSVTITGLVASTTYYFVAKSVDPSSGLFGTVSQPFTTASVGEIASIPSLTVYPSTLVRGQPATVSWISTGNVAGCMLNMISNTLGSMFSDSYGQSKGATGSFSGTVPPNNVNVGHNNDGTSGYVQIGCFTGANFSGKYIYRTVKIVIPAADFSAPTITSFTATPSNIFVGGSATLSWTTANVTSCWGAGTGPTVPRPTTGSVVVSPSISKTYSLVCGNSWGGSYFIGPSVSATVTVNVNAFSNPITSFTITPSTTTPGHSVTLAWTTSGSVGSCAISGVGSALITEDMRRYLYLPINGTSGSIVTTVGSDYSKDSNHVGAAQLSCFTGANLTGVLAGSRVATTLVDHTLSVSKDGSAPISQGTISGGGIDCGSICSIQVASGKLVTLTATPAAGSAFFAWSGGAVTISDMWNPVFSFIMSTSSTVSAFFTTQPVITVTLATTSPTSVYLTWKDQNESINKRNTYFKIDRATSPSGPFTTLDISWRSMLNGPCPDGTASPCTLSPWTVDFRGYDGGLTPNTTYYYRITRYGNVGCGRYYESCPPVAMSSVVSITTPTGSDTIAPTVSLTAPADNATVSGTTNISANATDNVGVSGVTFRVDGTIIGSEVLTSPYSVSWTTTGITNGIHTITATVRDAVGNAATSTISVTVNNTLTCGSYSVTGSGSDVNTYGTVLGPDGRCWLNRNLGSSQVAQSSTDPLSYGSLYQWGRGTDGHQSRTSTTTTTLSLIDDPGHPNFILSLSSPYDWRSPQKNTLWQGVSGINNPCPTGFRIPTSTEWGTLASASPTITNSGTAFSSTLKLPVAGYRILNTGLFSQLGTGGYYWSSDSVVPRVYYLSFYSGNANPANSDMRAFGFSVRCVKN